MKTLTDLMNWHEAQRRLAMMAQMSSSDALTRAADHSAAITLLKTAIAEAEAAAKPPTE